MYVCWHFLEFYIRLIHHSIFFFFFLLFVCVYVKLCVCDVKLLLYRFLYWYTSTIFKGVSKGAGKLHPKFRYLRIFTWILTRKIRSFFFFICDRIRGQFPWKSVESRTLFCILELTTFFQIKVEWLEWKVSPIFDDFNEKCL